MYRLMKVSQVSVSVLLLLCGVQADYQCVCNYQIEASVYGTQDDTAPPVGFLYEFDCKPVISPANIQSDWYAIMNEQKIAYIKKSDGLAVQVCQGSLPSADKVTTMSTSLPTSSLSTRPLSTSTTTSPTTASVLNSSTSTTINTITADPITSSRMSSTISRATTESFSKSTTPLTSSSTTQTMPSTSSVIPTLVSNFVNTTNPNLQVTGQGTLSLCPHILTRNTDKRWIRQHGQFCYELVSDRYEDWYDAEDDCRDRYYGAGGTLLEIYTNDIQTFIMQFLKDESHNHPVWIGLQDVDREESFDHWETDTKVTYENFDPNRKNNYAHHSQEDCVLLETSGLWDDSVCDQRSADIVEDGDGFLMGGRVFFRHSWICQYPAKVATTNPPTTVSTTAPSVPLSVSVVPVSSQPVIEGDLSLCPTTIRQVADDSFLRQYSNYCYELVSQYKDWYDASQYCMDRVGGTKGRLVEIYTLDIQNFLMKIIRDENYVHPVWIGLQDVDKEEIFDHWDSDIPVTYQNFDPNRKDNYANHAQENCVLLEPSGYWDDSVCDVREANQAERDGHPGLIYRHQFICQYPIQQSIVLG